MARVAHEWIWSNCVHLWFTSGFHVRPPSDHLSQIDLTDQKDQTSRCVLVGLPILPKSSYTNKTPLANVKLFFLSERNAILLNAQKKIVLSMLLDPLCATVSALNFHPHSTESCGQEILDLTRSLRTVQGAFRMKGVHVGHCKKQRATEQVWHLELGGAQMCTLGSRRWHIMARDYLQTEIRLERATVNYLKI